MATDEVPGSWISGFRSERSPETPRPAFDLYASSVLAVRTFVRMLDNADLPCVFDAQPTHINDRNEMLLQERLVECACFEHRSGSISPGVAFRSLCHVCANSGARALLFHHTNCLLPDFKSEDGMVGM